MSEDNGIQRHRLDVFALTVGLLALAGCGLVLGARADVFEVDALVVLATLWVVVGVVGLVGVVHRLLRPPAPEVATTASAEATS